MISNPDEQTLIRSAREGSLEAFNLLIERHEDFVFRIALRMLGDEDRAADAAQMAWMSVFHKIEGLRGTQLRTWLARVIVNTCYDEIRRTYRRRETRLLPLDHEEKEIDEVYWLADPTPGVEETVENRETERTIHACLESLTADHRSVLILVDIEGLSYEEAARAAGVPVGTIRSRLARARMAMRARLRQSTERFPASQGLGLTPCCQTGLRYT